MTTVESVPSQTRETSQPACHHSILPKLHRGPQPLDTEELGALQFFAGLSQKHLDEIAPHTKLSHFEPGEVIFHEHDLADRFYVLLTGKVAIECKIGGETVRIQEAGPGECVGFSWFFSPEELHFTARVIEPVTAVFFFGTLLKADCELDPTLGYELIRRTGQVLVRRMESVVGLLARRKSGGGCGSGGSKGGGCGCKGSGHHHH